MFINRLRNNPILEINDSGIIFLKNNTIAIGLALELPEIFTITQEKYNNLYDLWGRIYKMMPDNAIIHRQDMYFMEHFEKMEATHFLSQDYYDTLMNKRKNLKSYSYVYFIKFPDNIIVDTKGKITNKSNTNFFKQLLFPKANPNKSKYINSIDDKSILSFDRFVMDASQILNNTLKEYGGKSNKLFRNDYLGTEENKYIGLFHKYTFFNKESATDITFNQNIKDQEVRAETGQHYFKAVSIDTLNLFLKETIEPTSLHKSYGIPLSSIHPLGAFLPFEHINNTYIYKINQHNIRQKFKTKQYRTNLFSKMGALASSNKKIADSIEDFLTDTEKANEDIVYLHHNTIFFAETEEHLIQCKHFITKAFDELRLNITNIYNQVDLPQLFWSGFPGNGGNLKSYNYMTFTLSGALCFLNHESTTQTNKELHNNTLLKLSDRLYGVPVTLDINDYPYKKGTINNFNMAIFGPSGSGKSLFVNVLLYYALLSKDHVIIFDKGGSYVNLIEMFKGKYYSYSETKSFSFNPFYINEKRFKEHTLSHVNYIRTLIMSLYFNKEEDFNDKLNQQFLNNGIREYYKNFFEYYENNTEGKNTSDNKYVVKVLNFDSFYHFILNILKKEAIEQIRKNFEHFEYIMKNYTLDENASYRLLLNAESDKSLLEEPLIVFETDQLKEDKELYGLISLVVTNLYMQKLYEQGEANFDSAHYTYMVYEEAWDTLSDPNYQGFYRWMLKTSRKFKGKPIIVTQELNDLFTEESKEIGKTILSNCATIVLMDLMDYRQEIYTVKEILNINDGEFALLQSLNKSDKSVHINGDRLFKELWMKQGSSPANAYASEISKMMFWAFNTNKDKKLLMMAIRSFLKLSLKETLILMAQIPESELLMIEKRLKEGDKTNNKHNLEDIAFKLIKKYELISKKDFYKES